MEATILLLFDSCGKMEKEKKEENAKRIKCKEKKMKLEWKLTWHFLVLFFQWWRTAVNISEGWDKD